MWRRIKRTPHAISQEAHTNTHTLVLYAVSWLSMGTHLQAGAASWASNLLTGAWTWTACGIRQAAFPWSPPSSPARPLPRAP